MGTTYIEDEGGTVVGSAPVATTPEAKPAESDAEVLNRWCFWGERSLRRGDVCGTHCQIREWGLGFRVMRWRDEGQHVESFHNTLTDAIEAADDWFNRVTGAAR